MWDAACSYAIEFRDKYGVYFEAAFDRDPHAPTYAFCKACQAAGFPIDTWVGRFFREDKSYGYFMPGQLDKSVY